MTTYQYMPDEQHGIVSETVSNVELAKKMALYNAIFCRKVDRAGFAEALEDPAIQLMLNHFYKRQTDSLTFDNVELTDSVVKNFFNDISLNNI